MINDWLDTAKNWPITATPIYRDGDEAFISERGYTYQYFSPYRPLNFVGSLDCVLVASTEEYHHFMFTKEPLPVDRVCKWELLPANDATWATMPCEELS